MRTLHSTAAAPPGRLVGTMSPTGGLAGRLATAAIRSVVWALLGAFLAVSTVASGGPVDPNFRIDADASDARWVSRLGRPHHRPLSLTSAEAELGAEAVNARRAPHTFSATVEDERWWASMGVPEGVQIASLTAYGISSSAVDRVVRGLTHDTDVRRLFVDDNADVVKQLRQAEPAFSGTLPFGADLLAAAAASLTSAAGGLQTLAAPVFGIGFRPTVPAGEWQPQRSGWSAGAEQRNPIVTIDAVPVGTDTVDLARPAFPERTAAIAPAARSGGMLTTILGNGGGLLVWQVSRRRRTRSRGRSGPAA
ncbi:MAG: hypothetical protein ACKOZU_09970 [Planctomycetaceae bacterium]